MTNSCLDAARAARFRHWQLAALALAGAFALAPAHAEKADRLKEMNIVSDRGGKLDQQNRFAEVEGNVVITKGTILMHADRVQVRQSAAGYDTAIAFGASGRPATFRQKRDGADEYVEGEADRLEYDARTDTVKFVNNAVVRRLRGAMVTDEISGNLITYDATTEKMTVLGGAEATPGNPSGRVRAVLTPNAGSEAAAEAADAAASSVGPLKMTPTLPPPKAGDKR